MCMVSLLSSVGAIAGIAAVCSLFLSLLVGAAAVVATFLITRKYYSKQRVDKSPSPEESPSRDPEESSIHSTSIQPTSADSLKLQPNPAYETMYI